MKYFLQLIVLFALLLSATEGIKRRRMFLGNDGENIVDLAYTITNESYVHPLHRATGNSSIYFAMNRIEAAEHTGTHIDSLNHFKKGGLSVDELPLKNLMGRGVMIDLTEDGNPLEGNIDITVEHLKKWEAKHGKVCCGKEIVFFRTGLGQFYESDLGRYLGTDNVTDYHSFNFPGIHPRLAKYLVKNRKVRVVGTDTMSTDTASRRSFMAHQILLKNDIVLIENLANLEKLSDSPAGFHALILPIKIKGGTGISVRVVAIKDEKLN